MLTESKEGNSTAKRHTTCVNVTVICHDLAYGSIIAK